MTAEATAPSTSEPREPVPVIPFRHDANADIVADPFGTWRRLRGEHRAFMSDQGVNPIWYILQYQDSYQALCDYSKFSTNYVMPGFKESHSGAIAGEDGIKFIPLQLDPPEHTKYRKLLNPLLSPGSVRRLEQPIREHCRSLIQQFQEDGEVDFLTQFAKQFPTVIFMRLMDLPGEAATLVAWVEQMFGSKTQADDAETIADQTKSRAEGAAAMAGYLADVIEQRRRRPGTDMISHLLSCEVDGKPIDDFALIQMCFLLYTGGLDTVINQLGYTFWHLAAHPNDRERIVADPSLIPGAVEEFLRFYPVITTAREVTHDLEFAGCPMKKGDRIVVSCASLNRDDSEFTEPDLFDMQRNPNRHLGFGAGPHRCVGSSLARMELRVALEEWHKVIPDYRMPADLEIRHHVGAVAGLNELRLVFAPVPRAATG